MRQIIVNEEHQSEIPNKLEKVLICAETGVPQQQPVKEDSRQLMLSGYCLSFPENWHLQLPLQGNPWRRVS